jgi:hypothetical protein
MTPVRDRVMKNYEVLKITSESIDGTDKRPREFNHKSIILQAMDNFAMQEAINFNNWLATHEATEISSDFQFNNGMIYRPSDEYMWFAYQLSKKQNP